MDLMIDTVSQGLRLSLISNSEDFHYLSEDKSCSHSLLKIVDEQLKKSSKTSSVIKRVFFNRGPGSFTGIKMGYVTAATFGLDAEVEIYSFTTFDLMCAHVSSHQNNTFVLNAFQGDYFVANKIDTTWDYKILRAQDLQSDCKMYFMGATKYNLDLFEVIENLDKEILKVVVEKGYFSKEIQPLYLKKSTAEIARDKKVVK
ncbi:MAG: hypothetical protein COB02_04485 [Candidatus Cloacimonadota bacterium]|nr:MAG: hypothetical protein COB02_04485 [Candidatus Cloacimonadota bacterium]